MNHHKENNTLEVVQFLKGYGLERNKALQELNEKYAIKVRAGIRHKNLVSLSYNSIESPLDKKLVRECRGLVLDKEQSWKVVSRGYDKFFNYGERLAAQIDWATAKVYEKLDGTLCMLYWYDNEWCVATTGTPDADTPVNAYSMTFKELFWKTFNEKGYKLPQLEKSKKYTYLFELMTPMNMIVVRHMENKLVLHGVRNLENQDEMYPEFMADQYGWECAKTNYLFSIKMVQDAADKINGLEGEGFVVADLYFNRIKIKSPSYAALHYQADKMSPKRMLDSIIRVGESDEFLQYFPMHKEQYEELKKKYDSLLDTCEKEYLKYAGLQGQWAFANAVKDNKLKSALFARRAGKSFKEFWRECPIRSLEIAMGLKEKK